MDRAINPLTIALIGSRGLPADYGGFETLVEHLSSGLACRGFNVMVVSDKNKKPFVKDYGNGRVKNILSGYTKANNPVLYYFDSLKKVKSLADLILVCGVGGSFFYPLIPGLRKKVVTHIDGEESKRAKFSLVQKCYVYFAEIMASKFSRGIITDNLTIQKEWIKRSAVQNNVGCIKYGAQQKTENSISDNDYPGMSNYYLVLCRLVPENNIELIIKGYLKSGSRKSLVIFGNTDQGYGKEMYRKYQSEVTFKGTEYAQEKLISIRKNCFAYLHGHSVGGTNPSLVEAMGAGCICICHDNQYNRETTFNTGLYFGNEDELAQRIKELELTDAMHWNKMREKNENLAQLEYNWDKIIQQYQEFFNRLIFPDEN